MNMEKNPQLELSRANLNRLYEILQREVGMDSLDMAFFEVAVERAFNVELPGDND